ncbi:MAG: MATE family efflux transporter [Paracoccaceae bacterium]|nr:MATE family efflux transporter [Paracoccaceae bacterium]MDG1373224.1 MATE family efflux transporter [Paracoccaceae bacterium]
MSGATLDNGPITDKRVLKIALPIVLSNATVPILGAVDTGVVGQMGLAAPIGAVGLGAIILAFVYWIFGFLRMGTAGLTAQALGAKEDREVTALLIRGLMIAGVAGLVYIILQIPIFWLAFQASPASEEVESLTQAYMEIRIWGAPATIGAYVITGWLVAAERTKEILILQLWINGLNMALDVWFVLGLGWGVEGVAIATLIAEWSGLALGLWMCRGAFRGTAWRDSRLIFEARRLKKMASVNSDIMIRSILLEIGFTYFIFRSSGFDDVTLAANQILIQFLFITAYAMDGFAFAAEALVGNALGARNRGALRQGAIISFKWGMICVVILAAAFWFGGVAIINIMTTSEEVRTVAYGFLIWIALTPPLGCPSWMLDGIFIGATRARDMRNAMLISLPIFLIVAQFLVPAFGNHGLWASMLIFFMARGVTLGLRYPSLEAEADSPR